MSTLGPEVVSNPPRENLASVSPCTHEEADTRMFVHVADHTFNGFTNVALRTTDIDVVVIAISVIKHLQELREPWIAFGIGKNFRYIPAHEIANQLGEARAGALPIRYQPCMGKERRPHGQYGSRTLMSRLHFDACQLHLK